MRTIWINAVRNSVKSTGHGKWNENVQWSGRMPYGNFSFVPFPCFTICAIICLKYRTYVIRLCLRRRHHSSLFHSTDLRRWACSIEPKIKWKCRPIRQSTMAYSGNAMSHRQTSVHRNFFFFFSVRSSVSEFSAGACLWTLRSIRWFRAGTGFEFNSTKLNYY